MSDPPEQAEPAQERAAILADIFELLRDHFALAAWGRVLIEVARHPDGDLRVADVQVEEILGDEGVIERTFGSPAAAQLASVLGKAVEALAALEGVDVEAVHGGTFVRADEGDVPVRVDFMPGLVSAPSPAFAAERAELVAALRARSAELAERFGVGAGAAVLADLERGSVEIQRGGAAVARGSHALLGSFSRPHRSWVWAASNPTVPAHARRRCREALDAMPARSAWEISTPGFASDEATAWALAGWVARQQGWDAVRVEVEDGFLVLGVEGLSAT